MNRLLPHNGFSRAAVIVVSIVCMLIGLYAADKIVQVQSLRREISQGSCSPVRVIAGSPTRVSAALRALLESARQEELLRAFPPVMSLGIGSNDGWSYRYVPEVLDDPAWLRRRVENPKLQSYFEAAAAERRLDLELMSSYYWASEYVFYGDRLAPFRTGFVVRLADLTGSQTRVEVFQVDSTVILGGVLSLTDTHGLPALKRDLRIVEPTSTDGCRLLDLLEVVVTEAGEISATEDEVPGSLADWANR